MTDKQIVLFVSVIVFIASFIFLQVMQFAIWRVFDIDLVL